MKHSFTRVYSHSTVTTVTGSGAGWPKNHCSIFGRGKRFISSPKIVSENIHPPYITGCKSSFPGTLKRPQHKAEYSSPFSNEDQNKRSYTSLSPPTWLHVIHSGKFPIGSLRQFLYRWSVYTNKCCIPSVMVEVRYADGDRAIGSWGKLFQARAGHLRIDIQDSDHNSWRVDNF